LSFFDEDDEPPRTTSRTRARPKPPPRRGRAVSSAPATSQDVLVRRMVAGIVGAVILLLLFFLVRACNETRHENALKDYNRQVAGIATESRQTGEQFFKQMEQADSTSPAELYQAILGFRGSAQTSLKQGQDLSVPDDMSQAHQSLLIALELRRDALNSIAGQIRPALGDQGEAADRAITHIAGDMRAFDASDVLYTTRVTPFINAALRDAEIGGQNIEPSPFLREISWVSPAFVASKLGQELSTEDGGGGERQSNEPTGPGLHGTGLDSTSYGDVTLQPGSSNRLTFVRGQPFVVKFTNQGENDEFNVKVTVSISRQSGSPITSTKTVPSISQGQQVTVEVPLNRQPPLDTAVTVNINVAKVPGEKTSDNNKSSYPTLFVAG
jgi:hypothetical protein